MNHGVTQPHGSPNPGTSVSMAFRCRIGGILDTTTVHDAGHSPSEDPAENLTAGASHPSVHGHLGRGRDVQDLSAIELNVCETRVGIATQVGEHPAVLPAVDLEAHTVLEVVVP